jgi:hypothetical protein
VWVMTRDASTGSVTFWESLTGFITLITPYHGRYSLIDSNHSHHANMNRFTRASSGSATFWECKERFNRVMGRGRGGGGGGAKRDTPDALMGTLRFCPFYCSWCSLFHGHCSLLYHFCSLFYAICSLFNCCVVGILQALLTTASLRPSFLTLHMSGCKCVCVCVCVPMYVLIPAHWCKKITVMVLLATQLYNSLTRKHHR